MNFRYPSCRRFLWLVDERDDRDLKPAEEKFLDRHRNACEPCRRSERSSAMALNMLRSAALEPQVAPHFDDRVARMARVQAVRDGMVYWTPALMGAGAACLALIAALQMIARPADLKPLSLPRAEARRVAEPAVRQSLELDRDVPILR